MWRGESSLMLLPVQTLQGRPGPEQTQSPAGLGFIVINKVTCTPVLAGEEATKFLYSSDLSPHIALGMSMS